MTFYAAPGPRVLKPHQLGWLRRPEMDKPGIEVWELPHGALYDHNPARGPLLLSGYHHSQITETGRPPDV